MSFEDFGFVFFLFLDLQVAESGEREGKERKWFIKKERERKKEKEIFFCFVIFSTKK